MKDLLRLVFPLLLVALAGPTSAALGQQRSYELIKGKWFDGNQFTPAAFYSVDGILTKEKPAKVDSTIDLSGLFVVPHESCALVVPCRA